MKYVTTYPKEKLWTKEWKRKYQYGVILFIPPDPIKKIVNKLRQKYDSKGYEICTAHISLTMPIKHPLTDKNLSDLRSNLKTFNPFNVTYGPLINCLPVAPGVVFKVNEQETFEKLYKRIEATPGIDFHKRRWPFKAHLTIAEYIDNKTTLKLTKELNQMLEKNILYGSFICGSVTYMVPNQSFAFKEIVTITLGK